MKLKYSLTTLGVLGLIIMFIVISCRKNEPSKNGALTSDNKIQIEDKYYSVINFGCNFKDEIPSQQAKKPTDQINQVNAEMSELDMINLLSDLKSHFSGDLNNLNGTPHDIVIYAQPSLNNLKYNKMEAFSVILFENSALKHYFFTIEANTTTLIQKYTQSCSFLYNFNFQFLASEYGSNSVGFASFTSTTPFIYDAFPIGDFNSAIVNDLNLQGGLLIPNADCGGHCPRVKDQACVQRSRGGQYQGWSCNGDGEAPGPLDGPVCGTARVNSIIVEDLSGNAPPVLDLVKIRYIRDNILQKYAYGQKYIDYYYKISYMSIFFDLINTYNIQETYQFCLQTQNVLSKFENTSSLEIPITPEYKNFALKMCDQYKHLTTNTYFTAILNTFEADINRFAGKTVSQILNEIK